MEMKAEIGSECRFFYLSFSWVKPSGEQSLHLMKSVLPNLNLKVTELLL